MTKLLRLLMVVLITALPHSGVAGLAMAAGGPEACHGDQNAHHHATTSETEARDDFLSAALSCDCAAQPIRASEPTLLIDGQHATIIEIAGLSPALSQRSTFEVAPPGLRPDDQKLYLRTQRLRC